MAIGQILRAHKGVQLAELIAVFLAAFAVISFVTPFAGENPLAHQAVVWVANVLIGV